MVPKPNVVAWPILYLKGINMFLKVHNFSMESSRSVIDWLHMGNFLASVDIKEAYLHIFHSYQTVTAICSAGSPLSVYGEAFRAAHSPQRVYQVIAPVLGW